ncbi:MAG: 4-hydroxybenzoate octaprenyltransferase [Micavibrio sp.]
MTHTDINTKGWISRLPSAVRPYALLMRLDRPIGTWLLLLPGWWAIVLAAGGVFALNRSDLWLLALFGVGAVVMRGAGCVINDLWDRNLDQKVERTKARPLASGVLSVRQALIFLVALLFIGLVILLQMSLIAILLGFLSLLFIIAYPVMKRVTWWPQAFLGLTFNFGALIGWAAVTEIVELPALLLYAAGFFWTLGYDTIYAHQDIEDDLRAGIKSTALRFGPRSKIWIARFYIMAWLLLLLAFVIAGSGPLGLIVLVGAGAHFRWQLRRWVPEDPASALAVFRSNRDFGLILLAAAALSGVHLF